MNKIKYSFDKAISIISASLKNNGVDCYWWNGRVNFGDLLTPELLGSFGKTAIHKFPPAHSKQGAVIVGSLIQMLAPDYRGNILGTGIIHEKPFKLIDANFWSVRGELTKKAMGLCQNLPTGDLGLLADKLISKTTLKKYKLGLIPHYVDKDNSLVNEMVKRYPNDILLIDVERSAKAVVDDIANCHMIASSSLHGIIVADSLGIPNAWLKLSEDVAGSGFKFHDYNSSIDCIQHPITLAEDCTLLTLEKNMHEKNKNIITSKKNEIENLIFKFLQQN